MWIAPRMSQASSPRERSHSCRRSSLVAHPLSENRPRSSSEGPAGDFASTESAPRRAWITCEPSNSFEVMIARSSSRAEPFGHHAENFGGSDASKFSISTRAFTLSEAKRSGAAGGVNGEAARSASIFESRKGSIESGARRGSSVWPTSRPGASRRQGRSRELRTRIVARDVDDLRRVLLPRRAVVGREAPKRLWR